MKAIISWGNSINLGISLKDEINKVEPIELITPTVEIFSNGETGIWIEEDLSKYSYIYIVKSLIKPINSSFVELLLVLDIIQRNAGADIKIITPWLAYTPQDKVFRVGEPLSSDVIINSILNYEIKEIITLDIHSSLVLDRYSKITNYIPYTLFSEYLTENVNLKNAVCVALDDGGTVRAQKMSQLLDIPFEHLVKHRDRMTRKIQFDDTDFTIEGKTIIAFDDFVGSGNTLSKSAKLFKDHGANSCIYCISHLFDNAAIDVVESSLVDKFITTNASIGDLDNNSNKTIILNVAKFLSTKIIGG